ncbi:hypothetical protein ABT224_24845 [Streptomyces sp. NPDC001584]|uniref:hypothetical protein n=1 Tax=Streptomyces sp. NPDC001584 TaxID=3154521 RepID=UPI0033347BC8
MNAALTGLVAQADPDGPRFISAREASYQRRADSTAAHCRVHLVCGDSVLIRLAQEALDATTGIHGAQDEQDRAERGLPPDGLG